MLEKISTLNCTHSYILWLITAALSWDHVPSCIAIAAVAAYLAFARAVCAFAPQPSHIGLLSALQN